MVLGLPPSIRQVEPAASRTSASGSEIAPTVVTSHTTIVAANQDATPRMLSPWVNSEARLSATRVNARPVPPRSSDAYARGNFKINSDRIACATENNTTATMNPDGDTETPGTTQAATSSPIAHDVRSTTARTRVCFTAISVGLRVGTVKHRWLPKPRPAASPDRRGRASHLVGYSPR